MGNRIKQSEVDAAFKIWAGAVGSKVADSYNEVGAYQMDFAYGGQRIEQIVSDGGGVRDVSPRLSKREMLDWIRAGLDTLSEKERCNE